MSYKINMAHFAGIFPMPNSIVDKHIRFASEMSIKTLLIIMRNSENPPSPQIITQILGVDTVAEIEEAILYWSDLGVLVSEVSTSPEDITPVPAHTPLPIAKTTTAKTIVKATEKNQMERQEVLDYISSHQEVNNLIHEIQAITGKNLTSTDLRVIVSLHSHYGLSSEYIIMAVIYCKQRDKLGMRYVESLIISWTEKDIYDAETLDKFIKAEAQRNKLESKVQSALGLSNRILVAKEKKFIDTWCNKYKFDIKMIKLAYERTIESIGTLNFAYVDKILESWHKKGIKTPKDAVEEANQFKKSNSEDDKPSYSHDELDKLIYKDYMK